MAADIILHSQAPFGQQHFRNIHILKVLAIPQSTIKTHHRFSGKEYRHQEVHLRELVIISHPFILCIVTVTLQIIPIVMAMDTIQPTIQYSGINSDSNTNFSPTIITTKCAAHNKPIAVANDPLTELTIITSLSLSRSPPVLAVEHMENIMDNVRPIAVRVQPLSLGTCVITIIRKRK